MNYVFKLAMALLLAIAFGNSSLARTKNIRNGTITMKPGQKAGLHAVYAWNKRCRSIRVRFKKMSAKHGRLYKRRGRFKIKRRQSKACAGRSVRGYYVVFKAKRRFKGNTRVRYSLRPSNVRNTYVFSRRLRVR